MVRRIDIPTGEHIELGLVMPGNIMSEHNVLTGEAAYVHSRAVACGGRILCHG